MTLTLSEGKWHEIYNLIRKEYGDITVLVSWRLRDTLGFTVRRHSYYVSEKGFTFTDIRLDFYNDAAATFFQLKYL